MGERSPAEQRRAAAILDEQQLLGAALQDDTVAARCVALLRPEHFTAPHHAALFAVLVDRVSLGSTCDMIEVYAHICSLGRAADCGGAAYLSELPEYAPSARLALTGPPGSPGVADRILARARRAQLLELGEALVHVGLGSPAQIGGDWLPADERDAAADVLQRLAGIGGEDKREEWGLGEAVACGAEQRKNPSLGPISTGLPSLDGLLGGGLRPGELAIVAGRPAMGKTTLAMGLALHAAEHAQKRVGLISLEMGPAELGNRALSCISEIPLSRIREGRLDGTDVLEQWRDYMSTLPLRISMRAGITPSGISALARRWAVQGLDMLVIDYLQRVRHDEGDRHDISVGKTSSLCKDLALTLEIPVVLLSQLNRSVESRRVEPRKKDEPPGHWWNEVPIPNPADLKDSGDIEQDADIILFPIRGSVLSDRIPADRAVIRVAKNRNGEIGYAPVAWDGPTVAYRALPDTL